MDTVGWDNATWYFHILLTYDMRWQAGIVSLHVTMAAFLNDDGTET